MFGKLILVLPIFIILSACAKPNYANPTTFPTDINQSQGGIVCQAKFSSGDCVSLNWQSLPSDTNFGTFIFKTYRLNLGDGSPVPEDLSGDIAVLLWMPSMGHGAPPVQLLRLDVGTYQASNIFFTMKGDWEIRFQTKNGTHVEDQAVVNYSL